MKIKCVNCGCKFDPGQHSNMCPACGTYNKVVKHDNWLGRELTPEEQAEYDAKYNREPMSYDRYPKNVLGPDSLLPAWFKKTKVYKNNPKLAYIIPGVGLVIITAILICISLQI